MLEKDSNGNIIGKLPATAKKIPGMELLVIPSEGALSEYSPEAYNSVNMFFINAGHKAFVDNFCNREWMEENKALNITEIDGICKIAAEKDEETAVQEVTDLLKKAVKPTEQETYKNQIENDTTLNVFYPVGEKYIHLELPYCTIEQIFNLK